MVISWRIFRKRRAREQYSLNRARELSSVTDGEGRINGQGREAIRNMPYGLSRVGFSGCEAIAVYNLLRDLGRSVTLAEVIRFADEGRCLSLGGLFGVLPRRLARLLRQLGIPFETVGETEAERAAVGSRYIAVFWNRWPRGGSLFHLRLFAGIHTVFLVRGAEGWAVFNRSNLSESHALCRSLRDVAGTEGRFIRLLRIRED